VVISWVSGTVDVVIGF